MKKRHQQQILELLETIREAQSERLYADCQDGALHIGQFIEQIEGEGTHTVMLLEEYCELLYKAHNGEISDKTLKLQLNKIEDSIKSDLKPTKHKVLFLPYYDNTWETMKSVYEAFSRDPMFEVQVVIIPIMRNTNEGVKFVWEDYLTPVGIPNTHYDMYSFEENLPDIVFYNQPYDGVNIPKFQSHNIRKYTDYMVYIPYYIVPINVQGDSFEKNYTNMASVQNCDLFIAQSERFRKQYIKGTSLCEKALAFGNPKCDCLYTAKIHNEFTHYPEWEKAIGKCRVILLNTHYSYMLEGTVPHSGVKKLIESVADNENLFLIWRPHPQVFLMKMSVEMQEMLNFAQNHKRMILDKTQSIIPAYMYSDAVVSLFPSSIVMDALFCDLPVFLLGREAKDNLRDKHSNISFYNVVSHENYDEMLPDNGLYSAGMQLYAERNIFAPLDEFLKEIESCKDSKREERTLFCEQEFPNRDGTTGKNILKYIKDKFI
ncbi:hypothetical protein [Sedimentibacter sp.]|uniref:hypothetical protein n=1 Tax=Sedimentibacter sp. TaxID=1960295 RepID=UPI0028A88823|nr:hypothetical protein [Sedimentibacter sp.]